MPNHARLGEEAFKRHKELTGEEFRLYAIIVFHTFWDTGFCRKNLRQLAMLHRLSYTHTTERYKVLSWDFNGMPDEEIEKIKNRIKSPWCEDVLQGIRPLVGLKVPKTGTSENGMFRKPEHDYSENRNIDIPENGTFEDKMFRKPEHLIKGYTEPLQNPEFLQPTTTEKTDVVVGENNGHKSQFSFEECARYVQLCEQQGQTIKNPTGLATYLYESGEKDLFIRATLYPEPIEQTIEYDDGEAPIGDDAAPHPLDEYELLDARDLLKTMIEHGANLSELKNNYTAEDWSWLMAQIN